MCSRSSKISDLDSDVASSVSLWWQDTDDEDDSVKPHGDDSAVSSPQTPVPANFILSRQKKLRKIAPEKYYFDEDQELLNDSKQDEDIADDRYKNLNGGTRAGTRKSLLRSTASTINIFK